MFLAAPTNIFIRAAQNTTLLANAIQISIFRKESRKGNKLKKYSKNSQKCTIFGHVLPGTIVCLPKNYGRKKSKFFAKCHGLTLDKDLRFPNATSPAPTCAARPQAPRAPLPVRPHDAAYCNSPAPPLATVLPVEEDPRAQPRRGGRRPKPKEEPDGLPAPRLVLNVSPIPWSAATAASPRRRRGGEEKVLLVLVDESTRPTPSSLPLCPANVVVHGLNSYQLQICKVSPQPLLEI